MAPTGVNSLGDNKTSRIQPNLITDAQNKMADGETAAILARELQPSTNGKRRDTSVFINHATPLSPLRATQDVKHCAARGAPKRATSVSIGRATLDPSSPGFQDLPTQVSQSRATVGAPIRATYVFQNGAKQCSQHGASATPYIFNTNILDSLNRATLESLQCATHCTPEVPNPRATLNVEECAAQYCQCCATSNLVQCSSPALGKCTTPFSQQRATSSLGQSGIPSSQLLGTPVSIDRSTVEKYPKQSFSSVPEENFNPYIPKKRTSRLNSRCLPSFSPSTRFVSCLLTALLVLPAIFHTEHAFAHAQPTYAVPNSNGSVPGTVVGIPSRPGSGREGQVPVFNIRNPQDVAPRVPWPKSRAKWPSQVNIGVLLPRVANLLGLYQRIYGMEYNRPAIECAVDDLTRNTLRAGSSPLPAGVKVKVTIPSQPLRFYTHAPMEAFDMTYDGTAHVLFGPYDLWPAAQINRYAVRWNVPVLTTSGMLFPPGVFSLTTRMQSDYTKLGDAVYSIIQHFNFTVVGLIYEHVTAMDRDQPFFYMIRPLYSIVEKGLNAPPKYDKISDQQSDMEKTLNTLKQGSRSEYEYIYILTH
ncbi:hypothetical protein EGW08_014461 [Elysia chlorotica]|uniref:Receptor ligand binding region domain-containing protein n=1 Tax=Elysia chlorotica TaxID=188477 RepID=A0A3S1B1S8_ELYCH|nr:hypothetical protein EGW08_014461 [Elysia chlorotica]